MGPKGGREKVPGATSPYGFPWRGPPKKKGPQRQGVGGGRAKVGTGIEKKK